ncbi:JAB domain-containing protein [Leptolyngbya sp. AN02str]|uniref:JAB domain-containing protein n=1 Tax=Leptolyngbya sp. AN02str TaxID=3423363 RepID=UPI003D315684
MQAIGDENNPDLSPLQRRKLKAAVGFGALVTQHSEAPIVDAPQTIANFLMDKIGWQSQEHCAVVALHCTNRIISWRILSIGSLTETFIPTSELLYFLVQCKASRAILAHNHPSGSTSPSQGDLDTTTSALEALGLLNIQLLDHLVLSRGHYSSIRAHAPQLFESTQAAPVPQSKIA